MFIVDTTGSAYDTVLSVFVIGGPSNAQFVVCNNNGAPDGVRSQVQFPGRAGTSYIAIVDGPGLPPETTRVNWRFGHPPHLTVRPTNQTAIAGEPVTLVCMATGVPQPAYQWRHNGTNITNGNTPTLTLASAAPEDAGFYSVVAWNFLGQDISNDVLLTVRVRSRLLAPAWGPTGGFGFHVSAPPNATIMIQAAAEGSPWTTIAVTNSPDGEFEFTDPNGGGGRRLYRAVEP